MFMQMASIECVDQRGHELKSDIDYAFLSYASLRLGVK